MLRSLVGSEMCIRDREDIERLRNIKAETEQVLRAQREAGKLYREVVKTMDKWEARARSLGKGVRTSLGDWVNVNREPGVAAPMQPQQPEPTTEFVSRRISAPTAINLLQELVSGYAEPDVQRNVREVIYLAGGDMAKRREGLSKVAATVQYLSLIHI
eukprot:TRINITY_DN3380_c0_g1_i2.p1 TRINITY_DN3380_c0_g1~~TRINITY_DN3380_c0_g1_i2.p1  ORF type:complete len:158 (+),score=45.11 TRINITY_DN3380_c0_g1_i2:114-587(+)